MDDARNAPTIAESFWKRLTTTADEVFGKNYFEFSDHELARSDNVGRGYAEGDMSIGFMSDASDAGRMYLTFKTPDIARQFKNMQTSLQNNPSIDFVDKSPETVVKAIFIDASDTGALEQTLRAFKNEIDATRAAKPEESSPTTNSKPAQIYCSLV